MKKRKTYFDEIRNHRIEDKFIEHLIRLLFFTVVIGIESIFQRGKEILFHIKNYFLNRNMSAVLSKYTRYKDSVHSLLERAVNRKVLHLHIHDTINTHFSEYEKRIVFGLKGSRDSIVSGSKKLLSSVTGCTKGMRIRYFNNLPGKNLTKRVSSSLISVLLIRKFGNSAGIKKKADDIADEVKYLNIIGENYRNYMSAKFKKFYTEEFRNKITGSASRMKTVRAGIEKLTDTIKRAEQRQNRYRLSSSSH